MADISKIILPNGNDYNLKDTTAREKINTHIIVSKTQPVNQSAGDIWVVIEDSPGVDNGDSASYGNIT